ncbi:hypothetical protein AHF37_00643 [Paragonimus kellicotti]|nr:hypothetical protein AHF37_00643 [Paragonimus kellicotti]
MQQALRDLAQAVINEDAPSTVVLKDCCGRSRSRSPVYASGPGIVFSGSHVSRAGAYGRTGSPPPPVNSTGTCYWGDSTMSAVQAALTKRGMQLSDMSSKLSNVTSQYEAIRAQLEDSENERRNLEHQLLRMRTDLDARRRERDDASRDLERCKSSLQTITNDKNELEKARAILIDQVKNLQMSLERTQNAYEELQKHRERMEEELTNLNRDEEKSRRENDRCQRCIESLEERLSAAREEGTSLRESLQCARLEAEIKATERADLQESLAKCEAEFSESCEDDSLVGITTAPTGVTWNLENRECRRKLDDELATYKQKLISYQEGQQRQANLVQRLQGKVLQYKEKCRTLELKLQLAEAENQNRKVGLEENTAEYEATLGRLEEEQQRASTLASVNTMLREQLDQVTQANQALSSENQRTREEAARFKEHLERREAEWRDEEAAFNDYFTMEHGRLLTLWRAVVACRRQFVEVKGQVEREINSARADVSRMARISQTACENFATNLRAAEAQNQSNLEWERTEKKKFERHLEELTHANESMRQQLDTGSKTNNKQLQELSTELEETKRQLADRERAIASLQRLRTGQSLCGRKEGGDINDPQARALVEEVQSMQQALRDLAQAVINEDAPSTVVLKDCCGRSRSRSPVYASGPGIVFSGSHVSRSGAYGRTGSPPPPVNSTGTCYWGDSTMSAVQAALTKRGMQVKTTRHNSTMATTVTSDISEISANNSKHSVIMNMTVNSAYEAVVCTNVCPLNSSWKIIDETQFVNYSSKLEDMHSKRQLMQGSIRSLETDFAQLSAEFRAVEADKASLREALSQMEAQKNEVSSEKNTLHQSLTLSEAARERLEDEISRLSREKIDVTEQLNAVTRHKNGLANEMAQKSRDIDRLREVIARLGNEKEEICREKGELLSQLRACERECCQVKELLASTKKEHQNLEADYYHSKQQLIQLETKCDLLANENQELNIKKANLLSDSKRAQADLQQEIERITQARDQIVQQNQRREQELQAALRAAKEANENEFDALRHQIVEARQDADVQVRDLVAAHKVELDEARRRLEKEKEAHSSEIVHEKQELQERVASLQRLLADTETARDQLAKSSSHLEKDRQSLRRHLEKVEREKVQREEILSKENLDRTELEITLRRLEEENLDQKRQVQYLQTRLGEIEQMHAQRLIEASKQNRAETELEMERLRNCQIQAERALEARERAHRQRVRALEEQVVKLKVKMTTIKEQLVAESRKRQQLQNTKPNLSKHSELPLYGSSRDIRRLLDDSVMCIKPNQSSTDLASKIRCPGSEKLTAFDRHQSISRGLRMSRK